MSRELFNIAGQVVIVTGGGRGLGAALAEGFAESRAQVVVADMDAETAQRTADRLSQHGGTVIATQCDITQPQQVQALVDLTVQTYGRLDVLVNNAGINIPKPAEELRLDEWNRIIDTNLTGTFLCCQTGGAVMLRQGAGCIINICSVHGHVGSYIHKAAAYNASKAGVINLTRSLALEWGERGVRVNGISPGSLRTDLMTRRLENPEYVRKIQERAAIKRIGQPDDIVGTALFLASPAAQWLTGQIIAVDGGWLAA